MSNAILTGDGVIGQSLYSSSATQIHGLGQKGEANGRVYRYVKNGAVAMAAGKVYQAPAQDATNFQDLTVAVNSIGDTTVTTTSTVTLTANQLAGGTLIIVSATTGAGLAYRIKSHPAATAAVVTFTLHEPIAVATTGTVKIDCHPDPHNGVIVAPTTLTSAVVGVGVYPLSASHYGWVQTRGPAAVLADGINAVGAAVVPSNGVTGAVEDAASPGAQGPQVGHCLAAAADTDYGIVFLTID